MKFLVKLDSGDVVKIEMPADNCEKWYTSDTIQFSADGKFVASMTFQANVQEITQYREEIDPLLIDRCRSL